MNYQNVIEIWEKDEYSYPLAYGFTPKLYTYLHPDDEVRDCMLVVPGGGYAWVAGAEAMLVAKTFYEQGKNCLVLVYTTNALCRVPLEMQPLKDLSRAIRLIRSRAAQFRIHPDRLCIVGFSAGGHLCASSCVHHMDVPELNPAYAAFSCRPDAAILSYPVITSGEKAHRGSIDCLIGKDPSPEELRYVSLETQVTDATVPAFIWQTETDELVPVENSYLFAAALREHHIPYALHIFSGGPHGVSVATEEWSRYADADCVYANEQNDRIEALIREGKLKLTDEEYEQFMAASGKRPRLPGTPEWAERKQVWHEINIWPQLADLWLQEILQKRNEPV